MLFMPDVFDESHSKRNEQQRKNTKKYTQKSNMHTQHGERRSSHSKIVRDAHQLSLSTIRTNKITWREKKKEMCA